MEAAVFLLSTCGDPAETTTKPAHKSRDTATDRDSEAGGSDSDDTSSGTNSGGEVDSRALNEAGELQRH